MGRLENERENVKGNIKSICISGDGQMICAGTEAGFVVYTRLGGELYRFPQPLPIVQVVATPDFKHIYVATLEGELKHLEFKFDEKKPVLVPTSFFPEPPPELRCPISHISLDASKMLLAVGYANSYYAVWNLRGKQPKLLWKGKSGENNRLSVAHWYVSLDKDGENLYVGSSPSGTGYLDVLSSKTGDFLADYKRIGPDITLTAMTAIPGGKGVIIGQSGQDDFLRLDISTVIGLSSDLKNELWTPIQYNDMAVTALAADDHILAVAVGFDGQIDLVNIDTGEFLIPQGQVKLRTRVNELAIFDGKILAAACSEGLAWLQYIS